MVDSTPIDEDPALQKHYENVDSSAECMGPQCRVSIDPEELFCSGGCFRRARRKGQRELPRFHKETLKKFRPNRAYMNQATVVDAGLWPGREDAQEYKKRQHDKEWRKTWGPVFSRYKDPELLY